MRKVRQGFLPLSGLVPFGHPRRIRVISMKYPKLTAAIDKFLAKQVSTYGAELVEFAIASLTPPIELPASSPEGAKEKLPPIPVTKELVLSEQTEVRNGN